MTVPSMTLFTWPEGLFPRRVTLYLKAKNIPPHILDAHLKIVDYKLDLSTGGIVSVHEPVPEKPAGSWPCMVVHAAEPGEQDVVIHESMSILEYLEDVFHDHGRALSGSDARARAHDSYYK
ncbi:hypothetical protein EJ05DRAFT_476987 [Pseudovirgaria hyperparasitica]|uniref:GST N-terminal domain-containing protein n=1 Tax=Pseudovirgaria hyperparasitica TaxID=470096 RepID=A0A6A6W738_9PEZI|nr:uncharacterized protein EJ05DRAFT_476987 [Pseudovirgaria hyperparasitica]KAF2757780.1 hypothetical protein EJ05DRAFT_476987 [Pseudovirgaria hyperparasitica]